MWVAQGRFSCVLFLSAAALSLAACGRANPLLDQRQDQQVEPSPPFDEPQGGGGPRPDPAFPGQGGSVAPPMGRPPIGPPDPPPDDESAYLDGDVCVQPMLSCGAVGCRDHRPLSDDDTCYLSSEGWAPLDGECGVFTVRYTGTSFEFYRTSTGEFLGRQTWNRFDVFCGNRSSVLDEGFVPDPARACPAGVVYDCRCGEPIDAGTGDPDDDAGLDDADAGYDDAGSDDAWWCDIPLWEVP